MEQVRLYKLSRYFIALLGMGVLFLFLCFANITEVISHIFPSIIGLFFGFAFLGYSIYLLRKRNGGKGFYWDDEGVVIDLNGNKVYWKEIEEIKLIKGRLGKSTVIYPHYTNHEKIRIRQKKGRQSIDWFLIEKPREYHANLMNVWEDKK